MPLTIPQQATAASMMSLIKKVYPQKRIVQDWKLTHPFLAMVTKVDDFVGSSIENPLQYTGPTRSRDFATAQDFRYPASSVINSITRVTDYGVGRIDAQTMMSMRNDAGGFVRLLENTVSNAMKSLEKSTAHGLFRNRGGAIGVISTITNGDATLDKITLASKSDTIWFTEGQKVTASVTDGTSGALRDAGDSITVRKIDFQNAAVYFEENVTTQITGLVAGDFLFNKGDFGTSFSGLAGWVPATSPLTGESFFGVDRSINPLHLAGSRMTDTALSIEESIQELAALCSFGNGRPTHCFMNPFKLKELALELDTKVTRDPGGKGVFGFSGLEMQCATGTVSVYGDAACPLTNYFLLEMDTWKLHSLGGLPHIVEDDTLSARTVSNADQVEIRCRLYGNLVCTAPGHNGIGVLAP